MGRPINDLTGERFNRFTVEAFAGVRGGNALWHCRCDCGTVRIVQATNLRSGKSRSCGCLFRGQMRHRTKENTLVRIPIVVAVVALSTAALAATGQGNNNGNGNTGSNNGNHNSGNNSGNNNTGSGLGNGNTGNNQGNGGHNAGNAVGGGSSHGYGDKPDMRGGQGTPPHQGGPNFWDWLREFQD